MVGEIYKFYKHSLLHICTVSQNLQFKRSLLLFSLLLISQSFLLSGNHIFPFFSSSPFPFTLPHPSFSPPVCLFVLPSDIPAVSLCPPDSESQLTVIQSEGELCDSCSSLGRPSSSCQLYHQVRLSTDCTVCCLG